MRCEKGSGKQMTTERWEEENGRNWRWEVKEVTEAAAGGLLLPATVPDAGCSEVVRSAAGFRWLPGGW